MCRAASNDPADRGIVRVLISGEPPEHGQQHYFHRRVPCILASARVGEHFVRHRGKAEHVIEFPICEQSGVGERQRSANPEHEAASFVSSAADIVTAARSLNKLLKITAVRLTAKRVPKRADLAGVCRQKWAVSI
jgi:hypothetical protein